MRSYALLALAGTLSFAAPGFGQGRNPIVIMETSMGTIRLELFANKAPVTVRNFLRYVDDKFYDDTIFHRITSEFFIQARGLKADLKERPLRAPIVNESGNGLLNERYTIAMARPKNTTADFFINLKDNTYLDGKYRPDKTGYAVFGRVLDGEEVMEKIRRVKTTTRQKFADLPVEPVFIRSLCRATDFKLVLGGSFVPAKLFTIAAYVDFPVQGQTLTLELPAGVKLIEGRETQPVPALATAAGPAATSLVLWKARVLRPGEFDVRVRSSTGMAKSRMIKSTTAGGSY
jgi:cyclophilin family peptidyl-prolyl cis-trans isomerase